jgi:hypothetical protein
VVEGSDFLTIHGSNGALLIYWLFECLIRISWIPNSKNKSRQRSHSSSRPAPRPDLVALICKYQ